MTGQRFPLSVSRRRDWVECGWKFRAKHIDKKTLMLPVAPLMLGSVTHDLIGRYIAYLVGRREAHAPAAVDHIWREYLAQRTERVPDLIAREALAVFRAFTGKFHLDYERVWQSEAALAVDAEGRPCEWFAPEVFLRAKIDLPLVAGDQAEIIDFKTNWRADSEDEVREDPQGRTYAFFLKAVNDALERFTVKFLYVRWDIERAAEFKAADCKDTWAEWLAISDNVQAALARPNDRKLWGPRPGPWCSSCEVVLSCPLVKDLAPIIVQDDASRRAAVEALIALDAVRANLIDQLKPSCAEHGPVDVNGKVAGWWRREGADYPTVEAYALAQKHGIAWDRILKVDTQAVKKIGKQSPELAEALEKIRVDRAGTEFKVKNAKGEE